MLSPGVALGHRYELEERVGAGGFSDVWRARDLTLDRTVAVKVLQGSAAAVAYQAWRLRDRLVSTSSLLANQSPGLLGPAAEPQPPQCPAAPVAHFRRPRRSAVIGGAAASRSRFWSG